MINPKSIVELAAQADLSEDRFIEAVTEQYVVHLRRALRIAEKGVELVAVMKIKALLKPFGHIGKAVKDRDEKKFPVTVKLVLNKDRVPTDLQSLICGHCQKVGQLVEAANGTFTYAMSDQDASDVETKIGSVDGVSVTSSTTSKKS